MDNSTEQVIEDSITGYVNGDNGYTVSFKGCKNEKALSIFMSSFGDAYAKIGVEKEKTLQEKEKTMREKYTMWTIIAVAVAVVVVALVFTTNSKQSCDLSKITASISEISTKVSSLQMEANRTIEGNKTITIYCPENKSTKKPTSSTRQPSSCNIINNVGYETCHNKTQKPE